MFFDEGAAACLARWLRLREKIEGLDPTEAPFLGETDARLKRYGVYGAIRGWAERAGVSDPKAPSEAGRFFPHCFSH